ncbi:MAG: nucleoside hydrolase [Clostridia bacterium]|nr:nucleoside hydrolase [Clostridia bacterium]
MKHIPVIIDCDTGVDDAIALLMAGKLPQLELCAVTSVAGNAEIEKTTINALRVLELANLDVPVYRGAAVPLMREQVTASYIHGKNGLNELELPVGNRQIEALPACDAIYEIAKAHGGALTIIGIGPLTNIALALIKYRELPSLLHRIVIMGGAGTGGNVTPAAEFNIFADAEAADIVFRSGVPVYMCGLDVTMKAYLTPEEINEVAKTGGAVGQFVHDVTQGVLDFSLKLGLPGMCMHDPVAVLYAVEDALFTTEHVGIRIETKGPLTYGKTVTDLYSDKQIEHNAYIVTDVDREGFRDRLSALIAQY